MANKTFVAKNGLTANTANVFMSDVATNLTAATILVKDSSHKIGSKTPSEVLTLIGGGDITSVTAGNGLTGGGTTSDVTVTLGTPATLTVSGTNTVGGTDHQHAITTSADVSGGTQAILASDSSGDLKVANFETGAALTVGTDLVVKDDISLDSDGAVLGFGDDNEITLTHVHNSGLTLNSTSKINFGDDGTFIHQSADGVLDLVSDTELELNATTIDINGAVEMSGVVTVATGIIADAQDGAYLGSGTNQFSDLYLADGAQILFGDDSEITLTHDADKGLTIKHAATGDDKFPTLTLAAGDTDIAVNDVIGAIDFVAPDEGTGTDAITTAGSIRVISEGNFAADNNASKMSFMLGSSGAASEVLSVSSAGVLTVSGNLVVSGTTTTVSSTTIEVNDPLLHLAQNNGTSDAVDIGFFGKYDTGGTDKFAGLFRDANDGKFRLFKDNEAEPDTTVNTSGTGYAVATLVASLEGAVTGNVTGDVTGNADTATALATARNIGGVSFDGTANITPDEITVADESSDTTCFMLFATAATGAIQPKTGTNVTFNSGTGLLTATGFSGNLTGTLQTAAQGNITSVGALDGGSITSGFGTIDTGSSTITTSGVLTGGSVVVTNESTIGSASDTDAIRIGAGGSVCFSNNTVLYGASNSTVAVASTQTFSGTIGTSATEVVFTFKAKDGTSGTIVTGATNYQGGEIVLTLKKGTDVETKKIMIHHDGDPSLDGTDIFITEFATLGTELGETITTSMGDADGTGLTSASDKHVHLKIQNPSGTDAMTYAGVAHLVEIPGDS
jgi:hypothetical protein